MRVVVQRVSAASVSVKGRVIGEIAQGLLLLLGIQTGDTDADAIWLAQKIAALRIFEDETGKMNLSVLDQAARSNPHTAASSVLVVSQFTLFASTRKGTRPSFNTAAKPDIAIPLYQSFLEHLETQLGRPVATGQFGAMMEVALVNDGPVTILLDSRLKE
jgi:D-tyrosyl-tRNA(Tyr) deacylase